ncbi:MAG: hypothetical protein KTR24_16615 [Saprospiraceae bacterium]|nr:hypothetical protein [Saprospiraceae bacterium]
MGRSLILLLLVAASWTCNDLASSAADGKVSWIRRSVLDGRPRMLTVALEDDWYLAYDLEYGDLYKMWQGGVHWDGAVFNSIKTIQPSSWGETYYINSRLVHEGRGSALDYVGYDFDDNTLSIHWQWNAEGETYMVTERPDVSVSVSELTLERSLAITGGRPKRDWQEAIGVEVNAAVTLARLPWPAPDSNRLVSDNPGILWLEKAGCSTCHEMEEKTVGPSYREIAGAYQGTDAADRLVDHVVNGHVGEWGNVAMPAHPHLGRVDIGKMVDFILSLTGTKTKRSRKKAAPPPHTSPGFGQPLSGLHPSLKLGAIRPPGFEPKVGGLDFGSDGTLYIACWDSLGTVYALQGWADDDGKGPRVELIASGLAEPLGLKVVDDRLFVLQKHELTELINLDDDAQIERFQSVCSAFEVTEDFHEFAYGLDFYHGYFYASLGLAMRLMATELQKEDRGTLVRMGLDGSMEVMVRGLRQPNGILVENEGAIFVTENQGQWVPANKFIAIKEGAFYGCRHGSGDRFISEIETPPAVWIPQDEIGNSPSQPLRINVGPYQGHFVHGEVTHGGLKRVVLEEVEGELQGCIFRFSQGFESGINRIAWAPDGSLVVGGLAMSGNWGWDNRKFGLQRVEFGAEAAFELFSVGARSDGLRLRFTEAPEEFGREEITASQWRYISTAAYGGPKVDEENLQVRSVKKLDDQTYDLEIPDIKPGHVIYLRLGENMRSKSGRMLWTGETWYTMNAIPQEENL